MAGDKSTLTIQQLISGQVEQKSTDWDNWLDCDVYTSLCFQDGLFVVTQVDTTYTAKIPFWQQFFDSLTPAKLLFNRQDGITCENVSENKREILEQLLA